jgi:hypothetical protein
LPKINQEEVEYEGTNNRIGKVCPFSRREEVCGEFVLVGEVAIHSCLILDVKKKMNESNVNLSQA